jgi:hypothetical protein
LYKQNKLRGLSPQANYIDRAAAACLRSYCQLLRVEGVAWTAQRIPTAVFSVFCTGAATISSRSSSIVLARLSGPRSRPTTTQKSGSAGNRTRDIWICSQETTTPQNCKQVLFTSRTYVHSRTLIRTETIVTHLWVLNRATIHRLIAKFRRTESVDDR